MPRSPRVLCCPRGPLFGAAALALLLGCASTEPQPREAADASAPDGADDPVRIKGLAPRLHVHRRRPGGIEELHDGALAHEGDLVQMSYMAAGNRYGVVVSLDGSGVVTLHYPERPEASATLVAHGEHALDHAYELDDAQPFERFVFVTSGDESLDPAIVLDAARRLAERGEAARHSPLPLPERWRQSSITLHKRP
ncbi:MAG: hypothetical protein KDK70_17220 [Myxococcales bacterium]|nr:hypothetical protein [Myxococcales bacterium]